MEEAEPVSVEETPEVAPTPTPDPADIAAMEASAEDLSRTVVQIQLLLGNDLVCSGSGTIVDEIGTIVTNYHVVENSEFCPHDRIGIAMTQSSSRPAELRFEADLLSFDAELDLAVVRATRTLDGQPVEETFVPVEIGDSNLVELGETIQVIGYPGIGGETVTFTTGSVSGFADDDADGSPEWIKTDASITGGNSGGLAADVEGRFIGIPTRAGAGADRVVDCRVITDSNGDGGLDGADSCVPIGGFINGLRPLALALPLLEQAQTAAPIDQGPPALDTPTEEGPPLFGDFPVWSTGVDEQGVPVDDIAAAVAGSEAVCISWVFQNAVDGTPALAEWTRDGELLPNASSEFVIIGTDGSAHSCLRDSAGLRAGTYEMIWSVDGRGIFAEAIIVGSGETSMIEVINLTDVAICGVEFNPHNTLTYGLNELMYTIEPGESSFFEVANGPLDTRIIDCNRDVPFVDPSGHLIDGDAYLEVV